MLSLQKTIDIKKQTNQKLYFNTQIRKNKDITLGLDLFEDLSLYDNTYFYEMSPFLYSGYYTDFKSRIKYTFRMLDMRKDIVSNDIHGKFYNELKTIFERNIHLYKFLRKALKFKPLNSFGIMRKKTLDVSIKHLELNYISGKYTAFRTLILDLNKNEKFYMERSIYSAIPVYSKTLFYNCFYLIKNRFTKNTIFILRARNKRSFKLYFMGFKFFLKSRKHVKYRSKKNISNKNQFFIKKRRMKTFSRSLKFIAKQVIFNSIIK